MKAKIIRLALVAALVAVSGLVATSVRPSNASAAIELSMVPTNGLHLFDSSPAPSCGKAGYHIVVQDGKATCVQDAPSGQQCVTQSNGVTYCNEHAEQTVTENKHKVTVLNLTSGGALQLMLEMNPKAAHLKKGACIWVTGGQNSYFNARHQLVWIDWTGKRAHICNTGRGPTGWQKIGPGKICWNFFNPPARKPKKVYLGKYKIVNSFNYTVKMSLKLTYHGTVTATARCAVGDSNNGASASGTASGDDIESLTVTGTGTGKTLVQAENKAHQAAIHSTQANSLSAQVTANATDKMTVSASASCHAPPPPPQVCTDHSATNYGGALPCQYPTPSSGSGNCTGISPSVSGMNVSVTANYSLSGTASLKDVWFDWGDGNTTGPQTSNSASHVYGSAGTRTVNVTLRFNTPNSGVQSSSCSTQVTVNSPPPVQHSTQLGCTWQEEITGGDSSLAVCDVQDDNGAAISLITENEDSNSQVSGINCYSQGGSSSCNGNGTFQFRIKGFNDGSSTVKTTVKVWAIANGVKSDPQVITIDVDPSSTGFNG